jgi:predicted GNAT family acetyltransferase
LVPPSCTGSPDLSLLVDDSSLLEPQPYGELFSLPLTITNLGTAQSAQSSLLIEIGEDSPTELSIPPLAPDSVLSHELLLSCRQEGRLDLQLSVDAANEQNETNESNNHWDGYADCLPPMPDLVATASEEEFYIPHELNSTFTFNLTTTNRGSANASESSTYATFDGQEVAHADAPMLASGESDIDELNLRCMHDGVLELVLEADARLEVNESDETNNLNTYYIQCGNVSSKFLIMNFQSPGHNISIREDHPRLYVTQEMIPVIRQKLDLGTPLLTDDFNVLKSEYENQTNGRATWACNMSSPNQANWVAVLLNTSNLSQANVCGEGYPTSYGGSWGSLIRIGTFLYWMTDNETYLNRSKFMLRELNTLLATYNATWNYWDDDPSTALSGKDDAEYFYTAWSSESGLAYDWLYNNLSSEERANFSTALARFSTYYHWRDFADESDANVFSHSFEVNSGWATALLALAYDPDLEAQNATLAELVLNQTDIAYARFLEFYRIYNYTGSDNGGWNWGTGYSFSGMPTHTSMAAKLTTATGTDWFAQNPWLQLRVINHNAYLLKPNDYKASWGDYDVYGPPPSLGQTAPSIISYYGNSPYNEYANWFISTHQNNFEQTYRWYNRLWELLWFDETANRRNYTELPLDWFSRNSGTLVSRTSWGNDSVWLTFSNNPKQRSGHLHRDANSFSLYYLGDQVVDSGAYGPAGGYGSPHWSNYYQRTIAHNTITVYDPNESFSDGEGNILLWNDSGIIRNVSNDGGQMMFPRIFTYDQLTNTPAYDAGSIPHYEANENYLYISGDATLSYNRSKLSNFTREIVFFKDGKPANLYSPYHAPPSNWSNLNVWNIVIFDRVNSTDPSFRKSFVMHFQDQPTIVGSLISSDVPGHIEVFNGTAFNGNYSNTTFIKSNYIGLAVQTVLPGPNGWNLTRIGGSGYEFWVDGRNYPNTSALGPDEHAGKWRIEISPTVPSTFDNFLNVLYVFNSSQVSSPAMFFERLSSADGTAKGVATRDYAAVFSTYGNELENVTLLPFTHVGATSILLADLRPSTAYYVRAESCGLPQDMLLDSSSQGTIYFPTRLCGTTLISASTRPPSEQAHETHSYEMLWGGKIAGQYGMRALYIGTVPQYGQVLNHSMNITFDSDSSASVSISAAGGASLCPPEPRRLAVDLDGAQQAVFDVNGSSYSYLNLTIPITAGSHTLRLRKASACTHGGHLISINSVLLSGNFSITPIASVDFSRGTKQVGLHYGYNGKDENYWTSPEILQHYRDVGTSYIRVRIHPFGAAFWPGPDPYINSYGARPESILYNTVPYNWSGSGQYNYTNLERDIRHVLLNLSATPYVNFEDSNGVGCPGEMMVTRVNHCGENYSVPTDFAQCAGYFADVTEHFYSLCTNGTWNFCGNFSDWYWAIGNEVDGKEGCSGHNHPNDWADFNQSDSRPENFINFFNTAYSAIKSRVPTAKVGGWDSAGIMADDSYPQLAQFLNRTNADFVSLHDYDNNTYYYGYVVPNWAYSKIRQFRPGNDTPLMAYSEYNFALCDTCIPPIMYVPEFNPLKGDYGAMWGASMLNWLARSNATHEMHFEGNSRGYNTPDPRYVADTSGYPGVYHDRGVKHMYGYGMWSASPLDNFSTTPMFGVRKLFSSLNPYGAQMAAAGSQDDLLEIFAVSSPHRAMTVINKRNVSVSPTITFNENIGGITKVTATGYEIIPHSGATFSPTLLPFEVGFFRLDGICPESWICSGWEEDCEGSGQLSRTCYDENSCGTASDRPTLYWACGSSSSCTDGMQNGDETGNDCGGSCITCPTCSDGVLNGQETGIDCGGSCAACPTCSDGVQNNGEAGVDCGGPCAACAPSGPGGGSGGSGSSGGGGGGRGGSGCTPNWECTLWGPCLQNRTQERLCTDLSSCGTEDGMPPLLSNCSLANQGSDPFGLITPPLGGNGSSGTIAWLFGKISEQALRILNPPISSPNLPAPLPQQQEVRIPQFALEVIVSLTLLSGLAAITLSSMRKKQEARKIKSQEEHLAEIKAYMRHSQELGFPREYTTDRLKEEGWDQHVIDEALEEIEKQQPPTQPNNE